MATYKVLQDIEADDKLLGPLSLKQFIFAIIAVGLGFINFRLFIASGAGFIRWPIIAILFIPMLLFAILASPIGKDQPTEIWLLARIRFYLKPRRRIWDQNGPKELVTITVPKRIEKRLVKDFNQYEVRSRLDALASVMDSRGWAVKNVNVNLSSEPTYLDNSAEERLVGPEILPQDVSEINVLAADDIMDASNNATAQHFEQMIQRSEEEHKHRLHDQIEHAREVKHKPAASPQEAANSWFEQHSASQQAEATSGLTVPPNLVAGGGVQAIAPLSQSAPAPPVPPITQPTTSDEQQLLEKVHERQSQERQAGSFAHLKTLNPIQEQSAITTPSSSQSSTPKPDSLPPINPDIINLARDNDKTVETLARQANKPKKTELGDGEVVISLH